MEELEGIVEEIIFRNDDNGCGWSFARGQGRTDCGRHAPLHQTGERVRFGTYINHPTFGRQMKASSYENHHPHQGGGD